MLVKIRFPHGRRVARRPGKNIHVASVSGGLCSMAAVSCAMLGLWRATSDLGWTDTFFVTEGIFSHSQVWLGLTAASGYPALRLLRYARIHDQALRDQALRAQPQQGQTQLAVPLALPMEQSALAETADIGSHLTQ